MTKAEEYRRDLHSLSDWTPYLLKHSGLPGPRGNLELAQVVAEDASARLVRSWLATPREQAPENSPQVFLIFCGVTALGQQAARGKPASLARLRAYAGDSRWRVREAVAIALQYLGDADIRRLLKEMKVWSKGSWYEQRAAVAALAEPRLMGAATSARQALRILDDITAHVESAKPPQDDAFRVLRQTLGYGWSVLVAAAPEAGKPLMQKWMKSRNADVRWIMRENLKKKRLTKMDEKWVGTWIHRLQV